MKGEKTPLAALVREFVTRERREQNEDPVTPEELLAYSAGELSDAECEHLRDRLARQPEAARAAADLARFPDVEPADEGVRLTDDDVAADWKSLRARLGRRESRKAAAPERRAHRRTAGWWPALAYATAALFLLTSLGLGWRVLTLQRDIEKLSRPRTNVLVESLPRGAFRDPDEPALRTVVLPPSADYLLLILPLGQSEPTARYRGEIFDADGASVWSGSDLCPDSRRNLTVELARSRMPPGDYRIVVHGPEGEEPVAAYRVRMEFGADGP